MRKPIFHVLSTAGTRIPAERILPFGAVDDAPEKPFMVYRLSGTDALPVSTFVRRPTRLEVWVHDERGSYTGIDEDLLLVEQAFAKVEQLEHGGERLSQVDFTSRSPDLFDTGFNTNTRMSQFVAIGRG